MTDYHGILIDVSQIDKLIFNALQILGQKKTGKWILYRISISSKEIEQKIRQLQDNMVDGFYFHFYKGDDLIIVFKERIFRVKTDMATWKEVIEYGKTLNIPAKQLDFYPCRVEDETY